MPQAKTNLSVPFIVACGCLIAILTFGPRSTMGFFVTPMTETNDWSREVFALAIAIQNLVWGLAQPFVGMLADKYGCLLYTSPSPRDLSTSRMPSSA